MTTRHPQGFEVEITTGPVFLTLDQLWPDGVPDNPTKTAVEALIKEGGGPRRVLDDWALDLDLESFVTGGVR